MYEDLPSELKRYYQRRYSLFSKFDEGIQLNHQQWYSVTPECIARTTALQIQHRYPGTTTIFDPFGGAAGNAIQFSLLFDRVVYNDLDTETYNIAKHNSGVYNVEMEFLNRDFFQITPDELGLENAAIFLSPPWGGPSYLESDVWDLNTTGKEKLSTKHIIKHCRKFTPNICLFLPKSADLRQVAKLVPSRQTADVDYMYVDGSCKGMCVYLGNVKTNNFTR